MSSPFISPLASHLIRSHPGPGVMLGGWNALSLDHPEEGNAPCS